MFKFEILRVGIAFDESHETDKLWGIGKTVEGRVFRFWGKRTKSMRVRFDTSRKIWSKWNEKTSISVKGEYVDMTNNPRYNAITKDLRERVERGLSKVS